MDLRFVGMQYPQNKHCTESIVELCRTNRLGRRDFVDCGLLVRGQDESKRLVLFLHTLKGLVLSECLFVSDHSQTVRQ